MAVGISSETLTFNVEIDPATPTVPALRILDFRYSKDGGRNWSAFRQLPMGEVGDLCKRLTARRLGQGVQWVFDIRVTDPVRCDILAASIQIEGER